MSIKKEQTTLRLPAELVKNIEKIAKENNLDVSSLIRLVLVNFCEKYDEDPKVFCRYPAE